MNNNINGQHFGRLPQYQTRVNQQGQGQGQSAETAQSIEAAPLFSETTPRQGGLPDLLDALGIHRRDQLIADRIRNNVLRFASEVPQERFETMLDHFHEVVNGELSLSPTTANVVAQESIANHLAGFPVLRYEV